MPKVYRLEGQHLLILVTKCGTTSRVWPDFPIHISRGFPLYKSANNLTGNLKLTFNILGFNTITCGILVTTTAISLSNDRHIEVTNTSQSTYQISAYLGNSPLLLKGILHNSLPNSEISAVELTTQIWPSQPSASA